MAQKRVLVADDDDSVRRAIKRVVEQLGCAVDEGSNYYDINNLMDRHTYDLIVCDNRMPLSPGSTKPDRTCGLQLLAKHKLSPHEHKPPFVLHTSDDSDETKRLVNEFGGIYRLKGDPSIRTFLASLLS